MSPTHYLASRSPSFLTVSDDQRARAGEIAEGLKGTLGLLALIETNAEDNEYRCEEYQGISEFSQEQVHAARAHQKQKHRLTEQFQANGKEAAWLDRWQLIWSILAEASSGLRFGQALNFTHIDSLRHRRGLQHTPRQI